MRRARVLVLWFLAVLSACGSEGPEAEIRGMIEEAALAAEERDTGFFRGALSEHYTDARGNDRDRLIGVLRGYFLAHDSIETVTRIESVELSGADAAEVVMFAGAIGRREGSPLISGLDGRAYRIELELIEDDGDWRVIGTRWERSLE